MGANTSIIPPFVVTVDDTAVPLSGTSLMVEAVTLQNHDGEEENGNDQIVFFGDSTVAVANGGILPVGDSFTLIPKTGEQLNLATVYVVCRVGNPQSIRVIPTE